MTRQCKYGSTTVTMRVPEKDKRKIERLLDQVYRFKNPSMWIEVLEDYSKEQLIQD